jgi:hypothetical protein
MRKSMENLSLVLFLFALLLGATATAAETSSCGKIGQAPCAGHQCARGLTLGKDQKCTGKLSAAKGEKLAAGEGWTFPNYQYVCASNTRLGDCGQWFQVTDSVAQSQPGGYLWTLYSTYGGVCPTGGSTQQPQNPLYSIVCVSKNRFGDCGQWFNVVATSTATNDGLNYLWILYSKYNGPCP